MNLGELFVKLGFDIDDKKLDDFSKSVSNAIDNIGKVTIAATAFVVAMDKIIDTTTKGVIALENFNAQTGLSIDKLQRLQISSQLQNIGLSADDVTTSIQTLQSNLAQIRIGQGNVVPFQLLGIDVLNQDAFSVIDQLRDKLKGIDDMTATNLIQQIGLNPQFITVLKMSNQEFGELYHQIALTTSERKQIMELGIEIKKLQLTFEGMINKTIARLEPFLKRTVQLFENIIYATQKMNLQIPFLIFGLTGILKVFKLLNLQTLGWTAALTALLLIFDDFAVWSQGGKSLFDYSGIIKFFNMINKGLLTTKSIISGILKNLTKIKDVIEQINDTKLGKLFALFGGAAGGVLGGLFGGIPGAIGGAIGGAAIGGLGGLSIDLALSKPSDIGKALNQINNWNINSNADATDVARAIRPYLDSVNMQLNNGGQ